MKKLIISSFIALLTLSGCSSSPTQKPELSINSVAEQQKQMAALTNWSINGKLAFISPNERQSANIFWQVDENRLSQFSLTTFLGINIVSVDKLSSGYEISADGKVMQGDNLAKLLWQLTGLHLPVEALDKWLKGIPYLSHDEISYNEKYQPISLTSYFNHQHWQVNYRNYRSVTPYTLAHDIVIKQGDLSIKLRINQWDLN